MRVRLVVVAATLAVLVTLAVGWTAPATTGDVGIKTVPISPMQQRIAAVAPNSPFAAAGGRSGDVVRLDRMSPSQRVGFAWLTAGIPSELAIDRAGREIDMQVVPARSTGSLRSWRDFGILAFTLLYIVIALLVTWKAQRSRAASLIVAFLIGLALSGGIVELRPVLPSPGAKLFADVVDALCICVLLFSQFFFALTFPPRHSKLRSWTLRIGVPVIVLVMTAIVLGSFRRHPPDRHKHVSVGFQHSHNRLFAPHDRRRRRRIPTWRAGVSGPDRRGRQHPDSFSSHEHR